MKTREWVILIVIVAASFSFTFSYLSSLYSHRVTTETVTITEIIEITPSASDERYERAVQELLQYVMSWVESHRGLRFEDDVNVVVLTREWVMEHWGVGFLNLTETRLQERILKSLFIISRGFNLTEFRVGRAGYIVAASAENKIYVVKEAFNPDNKLRAGAILAHELMHILQGKYFKLPDPSTSDERNAFNALIEGDAGLLSSQYVSEHGGFKDGFAEGDFDPLTAIWLFPYLYGESFVEYVYEKEGWSGVNALYENLPRSTAEILHPEKYMGGWRSIKPNPPPEIDDGWKLMMQDTLGEFFIRQMLRAHLPFSTANRSAEGWRGDLIQLYEKDDAYIIRWKIIWEDSKEAEEFLNTFRDLLKKVGANQTSANSWATDTESITVETSETEILIKIVSPPMRSLERAIRPLVSKIQ